MFCTLLVHMHTIYYIRLAIHLQLLVYFHFFHFIFQVQFQKGASASAIGKAKFCHKLLVNPCMVTFAHFMHNVLNVLSKLSLTFQSHSATLFNIHLRVEASQNIIMKYKDRYLYFLYTS